jgi:hypothetical protein
MAKNIRKPDFKTAIPKQRYKLGEYTLIFLGDISSGNEADYLYILAVIRDGDSDPTAYITVEMLPGEKKRKKNYQMRIILEAYEEVLGSSERWSELDKFVEDSVQGVKDMFDMSHEEHRRVQ